MVETEFLFGFQPKDRRYGIVSRILKAYVATKPFPVYYPVSALIEIREVMASHGKTATERLNVYKGEGDSIGYSGNRFIFR